MKNQTHNPQKQDNPQLTNTQKEVRTMRKLLTALVVVPALVVALSSASHAKPPTSAGNLVGTWVNVQPSTGGIVKVIVTQPAVGVFRIHTYGACSPVPCDHGTIAASLFSRSVGSSVAHGLTGQYNFGFSTMLVTAQRQFDLDGGSYLELETRTKFAAGDTRNDYMRTELFRK